jgi:galactokinase
MNHAPEELQALQNRFLTTFGEGSSKQHTFYAPGRVNLIGDHTDYTGGLVFPCGIDRGCHLIIRRNNTDRFRFASSNFEFTADLGIHDITSKQGDNWVNYPLGIVDQFRQRGINVDGLDCMYSGNIPNGAGLSSSASIEIVTAIALNTLYDAGITHTELAQLAQAAENEFVGMQCGIMDQFAVAMAQADHAMLLDCHTLEYRQVPLDTTTHTLVVINTNQRRELSGSAYNDRVAECARALATLAPDLGISRLGELMPEALEAQATLLRDDPVALSRARHIAGENERVRMAVPALEAGDLASFGQLMNASHDSLAQHYQVSSEPLDSLVSIARDTGYALGARLTGAGFGGCTVNLVDVQHLDAFEDTVGRRYAKVTGLTADFYRVSPGAGAGAVTLTDV